MTEHRKKNIPTSEWYKKWEERNTIFMHLQQHNSHLIKWQKSHIWKEKKTGKIKEALYINTMDQKKLMNLEKGFEINQHWNECNPQIIFIAVIQSMRICISKICILVWPLEKVVSVSQVTDEHPDEDNSAMSKCWVMYTIIIMEINCLH